MSNLTNWQSALKEAKPKFLSINPNEENALSELGFAMQVLQNSRSLQGCDPQSILNAVVNVARTSVTLNPVMRLAYLVPRKGKCVLDFSYMGLVAMLRDNNCIKSISAHIVYEDEEFDYDVAYNKITHKPSYAKTEEQHKLRGRIGCYSRATLPNGEVVFEFMPMWEIDKVKSLSLGSSDKFSAWQTWEEEMIKKVVIKRHFKMLISLNPSEALKSALQVENDNNGLIGGFGVLNATASKKRPSLMSAFDEDVEDTNQLSILEDEKEEQVVTTYRDGTIEVEPVKKPIDTSMDFSEEEIESMLEQEAQKALNNFTEPSIPTQEPIDLFPSEDEESEDNDIMGWFPTPKE
jgi:recombination protein RecT